MKLQDFDTLALAQPYIKEEKRMTSPDMLISFLTLHDCVTSLQTSTDEKAKGFNLALLAGVKEFNLMSDHPVGQAQIQLLSWLVSVGAVNQAFYDACYNYANYQSQPFQFSTEHDFQYANGTIKSTRAPIAWELGHCTVTTTEDCPAHIAQIYERVVFSDGTYQDVRKAHFLKPVSAQGMYRTACPNSPNLYVDNVYAVMPSA
jgi:hypothetical protein